MAACARAACSQSYIALYWRSSQAGIVYVLRACTTTRKMSMSGTREPMTGCQLQKRCLQLQTGLTTTDELAVRPWLAAGPVLREANLRVALGVV